MIPRPFQKSLPYFVSVLDAVLAQNLPSTVRLAEMSPGLGEKHDPAAPIHPHPRLSLVVAGLQRHDLFIDGKPSSLELCPGEALFWPGMTWDAPHWSQSYTALGIVFRPTFVRFVINDYQQGAPHRASPWTWHTSTALAPPGIHLLRALESFSNLEKPDDEDVRQVFRALLRCTRAHLADSASASVPRSLLLWQTALEFLHQHYRDPEISRESVAAAVDVHPNYLSAIAAKHGNGFHAALEAMRIDRARHLLRQGETRLEEVARHCGYSGCAYFIRAFKRLTGATPGSVIRASPK